VARIARNPQKKRKKKGKGRANWQMGKKEEREISQSPSLEKDDGKEATALSCDLFVRPKITVKFDFT